jgi:hypothetical protein
MMNSERRHARLPGEWIWLLLVLVILILHSTGALAVASDQTFATPEDAASALVAAVKSGDSKAIRKVLGDSGPDLSSGDPVADRKARENFVTAFEAKHSIARDGDAAKLLIGNDDFPFAFPLVKTGDRWRFDTIAGKTEIIARRIGENELYTIKVMQAIADAQRDYASEDRDGDGVLAYAQKFLSSPGKRDGLYWKTKAGETPSPLGPLVVDASSEGYRLKAGPTPYHGYFYRMLKGQGAAVGSPAFDYVVHGRAIGGFAVIAYPAKYGSSGIMTFIINQDGKVFQSDLGPRTAEKASATKRFDPGTGWSPAQ